VAVNFTEICLVWVKCATSTTAVHFSDPKTWASKCYKPRFSGLKNAWLPGFNSLYSAENKHISK